MSEENTTVTLILTPEQRKQFKVATGQDATELQLRVPVKGQLSGTELGQVHGGSLSLNFAQVEYKYNVKD